MRSIEQERSASRDTSIYDQRETHIMKAVCTFAAVTAMLFALAPVSQADVLVRITEADDGSTLMSITGSYDVTGGVSGGGAGMGDAFAATEVFGTILLYRVPEVVSSTTYINFGVTDNPVNPIVNDGGVSPSGLTVENFQIYMAGNNYGLNQITVFGDAPLAGTLNESLAYPTMPFTTWNEGVWDTANYGGAPNDGMRLEIVVPAPGGAVVLGLGGLVAARRRR